MATRQHKIVVPREFVARCMQAGVQIAADYADPDPHNAAQRLSRTRSMQGIEKDPVKLGRSKVAEVAFCLWAGFDPNYSVMWRRHPDDGYDVAWFSALIDVKHTEHINGCMIWPISKNNILSTRKFDVMVLITGGALIRDTGDALLFACGWITRREFERRRHVAGIGGKLLPGTWFVNQIELAEMDALPAGIEFLCANDPEIIARST